MGSILWMIDLGGRADRGQAAVGALARARGDQVLLCHATGLPPKLRAPKGDHVEPGDTQAERQRVIAAKAALGALQAALQADGVEAQVILQGGHPEDVAAERVREHRVGLVVAGRTRSSGLDRLLLGNTTRRILRAVAAPTLVLGDPAPSTLRRVLCPIDIDEPEEEGHLLSVADLSRRQGAGVVWLGVEEGRSSRLGSEDLEVRLCRKVEAALGQRLPATDRVRAVVAESVLAGILEESEGVDLIALRHSGRRGIARLLAGDTAERVVAACPLSVLVSH